MESFSTSKRTLKLPKPESTGLEQIETNGSVVIVGANGAGKSRLGAWIECESAQKELVHRVSAQKSLKMPTSISPKNIDTAQLEFLFGHGDPKVKENKLGIKIGHRWSNDPVVSFLNDFERLMIYLFSEDYEKSTQFRVASKESKERIPPPNTKLDTIKRIWEDVLPYRELLVGAGKIEAREKGDSSPPYSGSAMSDGERVIFYLIGQCLSAPDNAITVIDEPELHLHRAIQTRLWNSIEAERPDCLFVYLTHDLNFAISRANSTKIWLKSFDKSQWDWHVIPSEQGIPEEILLNILGSRKSILFIEGERDSLDYFIFSHLYPQYTLTPCGGCSQVIAATHAFSSLKSLHDLECCGIIDRDFRSVEEVAKLEKRNIFSLEVSEIENLLLTEETLRLVARESLFDTVEIESRIGKVKQRVFEEFEREKERVISSIVAGTVRAKLMTFDSKVLGMTNLQDVLDTVYKSIDVKAIYTETSAEIDRIIDKQDYSSAIKVYDSKGLIHKVILPIGRNGNEYCDYVKRLLAHSNGEALRQALRQYVSFGNTTVYPPVESTPSIPNGQ